MSSSTPMMAQWHECKAAAPEALLLFRLGDFYEAFYDDAKVMSKEVGLTLTARQGIPMCGVPFHNADVYVDKLVAKGFKVAIAEQMEDPKEAKGIVKREIVRIVTPGTLIQSELLSDKKNNFFVAVAQIGATFGCSCIDLSTGEFRALELDTEQDLLDELCRLRPAEFLVEKKFKEDHPLFFKELSYAFPFLINERKALELKLAGEVLTGHFQTHNLDGFGLRGQIAAVTAAGSLLLYLKEEMNLNLDHVLGIQTEPLAQFMSIDRMTARGLELTETMAEGKTGGTLLDVIDKTCTPMGARLIRQWVKYPLLSVAEITRRQEAIGVLLGQDLGPVRKILSEVRDLERLMMKIASACANPRTLLALGLSLSHLPALKEAIPLPLPIGESERTSQKLVRALHETPPLRIGEGDIFQNGYNTELDQLREIKNESLSWMARYQVRLREETGIKTLKVGYTKAFGYYIEVSRSQGEKVPEGFKRRQTLVNGERFITAELQQFEQQILTAEERAKALETTLFENLRLDIAKEAPWVYRVAKEVGRLDALVSLAETAQGKGWVRPVVDGSNVLEIVEGRHPVVEAMIGAASFIANDTRLGDGNQMMLITGPNMAGKSTYLRQVALIAILAQMGSYVPAKMAHIGVLDRIFSRIGASDDLARGQSTFMVEMTETANILNNATSRSLVLLDEVGRGTSTYDGISIAWAVAEYLLTTPKRQAKTLFATHYWELTRLADLFPNAANFQTAVCEAPDGIVFLRKIVAGGTDKSYGIHVAKLAGLPAKAIQRAEDMLRKLEARAPRKQRILDEQLPLFADTHTF